MGKQNNFWQPMTLQEVVGIFALPVKKPPDKEREIWKMKK